MLKKENKFALPLIFGLCITWLGNFEAEAKNQVEANYGNPVYVYLQHAYSENRAKRESGTSETGPYIDEDQSDENTNDDQQDDDDYINYEQSAQSVTDQQSQINNGQSGKNTNDDQQGDITNDDQQGDITNDDQQGDITSDDQQGDITNDDQSGQDANNTQADDMTDNQQNENKNDSSTEDNSGPKLPDENFQFPKTVKQTYWNYYSKRKPVRQDNQDGTGPSAAYGSKRVQIEIPPEFNSGSAAVSNKANHALKWHVGIYTKTYTPYMQICGGTLVTLRTVISAAHCFWEDHEALPAEQFAVGAGKLYRPWFDSHETYSQTSDVSAIHIPTRYRGSLTNYQDDIALVKLSLYLTSSPAVQPACVSFDETLDEVQLSHGTAGTVMGWGLTQQDGGPSQVLNYVELPPLPIDKCFEQAGVEFIKYITSDKICAGVTGQGLCMGDSGGGLVFLDNSSPPVPYLRGVASTAPSNGHACNTATFATFTHVLHQRSFLLKHVPQLERDCKRRYKESIVEDKNSCRRSIQTLYSPYYGTTSHCECYTS